MFRFCYPMTSSKQIDGCSGKKGLEIELLQANRARSSYLTRSYTLSNRPLNSRSCCVECKSQHYSGENPTIILVDGQLGIACHQDNCGKNDQFNVGIYSEWL